MVYLQPATKFLSLATRIAFCHVASADQKENIGTSFTRLAFYFSLYVIAPLFFVWNNLESLQGHRDGIVDGK